MPTIIKSTAADSAEAYYKAMNDKDANRMAEHLHPDVCLVTPMEQLTGKTAVFKAATRLMKLVQSVSVHAKFGTEDEAMLAYNMDFGEQIGVCRAAVWMKFKDGLIVRNEIFFDPRPFARS